MYPEPSPWETVPIYNGYFLIFIGWYQSIPRWAWNRIQTCVLPAACENQLHVKPRLLAGCTGLDILNFSNLIRVRIYVWSTDKCIRPLIIGHTDNKSVSLNFILCRFWVKLHVWVKNKKRMKCHIFFSHRALFYHVGGPHWPNNNL